MLGRDIGFYVFPLPLLEIVHGTLLFIDRARWPSSASRRYVVPRGSSGSIRSRGALRRAARHAASVVLAAALLLVLAFGAWLQIPQLLTTPSGVVSRRLVRGRPRAHAGATGARRRRARRRGARL